MQKETAEKVERHREVRLYARRWLVLGVFTIFAASNASQWVEYSIITNIIVRYYGVGAVTVDWTSMIAMALYPILIVPASYMIDKVGLRYCVLFAAAGTTFGIWIKIFSVQPHLFWIGFLGQALVFICQTLFLSLPPKIASVWFGPDEVSTACGIGISGTQLGTAFSFILPPLIVRNHELLEDIGRDLSRLFYTFAIFSTISTMLIFIFFKDKPPSPPTKMRALMETKEMKFSRKVFWASYKSLLTDWHFVLHGISYGINLGVYVSVCTMLNQFILEYFENAEKDAGVIGLLMVIFGLVGILMAGPILDKTKKYKESNLVLYGLTILGVGGFMIALESSSKILVYVAGCVFGLFESTYYTVGMEFGVELSYPQPESSSTGLLLSICQTCGVALTLALGQLYAGFGTFWALIFTLVSLLFGGLLALFVPGKLLRQQALMMEPENKLFLDEIGNKLRI